MKRFFLKFFLVVVLGTITLGYFTSGWDPRPLLMDRGFRLRSLPGWLQETLYLGWHCFWGADRSILTVREVAQGDYQAMKWLPIEGQEDTLTVFDVMMQGHENRNDYFNWWFSPDGQWLLTLTLSDTTNVYQYAHVEGKVKGYFVRPGRSSHRPKRENISWENSGRGWIEKVDADGRVFLRHYSIQENKTMEHRLPEMVQGASLVQFDGESLVFMEERDVRKRTQVEFSKLNLAGDEGLESTQTVMGPSRPIDYQILLAPDGMRILWVGEERHRFPKVELHSEYPYFSTHDRYYQYFWISQVDGADMRMLGRMPINMRAQEIHWTPDSTGVSFVHDNTLWVVPIKF